VGRRRRGVLPVPRARRPPAGGRRSAWLIHHADKPAAVRGGLDLHPDASEQREPFAEQALDLLLVSPTGSDRIHLVLSEAGLAEVNVRPVEAPMDYGRDAADFILAQAPIRFNLKTWTRPPPPPRSARNSEPDSRPAKSGRSPHPRRCAAGERHPSLNDRRAATSPPLGADPRAALPAPDDPKGREPVRMNPLSR
jgi:hypothetical protein